MNKNLWWGYRHVNGSLQVKRYFSVEDINEAKESPFVEKAYGPFQAEDREDALLTLKVMQPNQEKK